MPHIVGKLSMKAITLLEISYQSEVYRESYGPSKSRESQVWATWEFGDKMPFGCGLRGEAQSIL
jgi:hypothetical protein